MLRTLCAVLLSAGAFSGTCPDCPDGDVTELLQAHSLTQTSEKLASLSETAKLMAEAKKECRVKQTNLCLPLLQDLRKKMWPYIMGELSETNAHLQTTPAKIREEDGPLPDISRAVLKRDLCGGQEPQTMYLVDLSERGHEGTIQNLNAVSEEVELQPSGDSKQANCQHLADENPRPDGDFSTLVMLRAPLNRFIAGYASLEHSLKANPIEEYKFLDAAKDPTERVKLFLHRFFQNGANFNSHVAPMAEYCPGLSKKVFARAENAANAWTSFLDKKGCKNALQHFNAFNRNNSTMMDDEFEAAMHHQVWDKDIFNGTIHGFGNRPQALLETSAETSTSAGAMVTVLGLYSFVYLRAFCWLNLPDYLIFDYNLPEKCRREDMQVLLTMTQKSMDADPMLTPEFMGAKPRLTPENLENDNEPVEGLDEEPAEGFDKEPAEGLDKEPVARFDNEPAEGLDKEPAEGLDKEPVARLDNEPAEGFDKEPAEGEAL